MNSNFQEGLVNTLKSIHIGDEFIETVQEYNDKVLAFVESQVPKVTKEVKIVNAAPWFDSEYKELRKHRRKAEKKFQHTHDQWTEKPSGNCVNNNSSCKKKREGTVLHLQNSKCKQ